MCEQRHQRKDKGVGAILMMYDRLCTDVRWRHDAVMSWCQNHGLNAKKMVYPTCGQSTGVAIVKDISHSQFLDVNLDFYDLIHDVSWAKRCEFGD